MKLNSFTRPTLGPYFSEAARQLWGLFTASGLSISGYAAKLEIDAAMLGRFMYGDRRPTVVSAAKIESFTGISMALWAAPPAAQFVPPGAQDNSVPNQAA